MACDDGCRARMVLHVFHMALQRIFNAIVASILRMESAMKVLDSDQWVQTNFDGCDLGDKRLDKRLTKIATGMLANPDGSIPKQNSDWSDVKAAYRFFDNECCTFNGVAQTHWELTRNTKPGKYLLICDTTDIDQIQHKSTTGLGILGNGMGKGVQLHSCLTFNLDEKQIVGSTGALLYYRKRVKKDETRSQRLARTRESDVWGNLVDEIGHAPNGSQWVYVWDRGGDNFEAMCHVKLSKNDWIIRASQMSRNVLVGEETIRMKDVIKTAVKTGSYKINLRGRAGALARIAEVDVFVARVTYPRPSVCSKWVRKCGIDKLLMNVVIVQETNPSKGAKPILWVLLTSLPVTSFLEAKEVIESYEHRWLIEEYHKVMKTGCSLEERALRTADRLEPLIALTSVIGTRLLQLKLVGRNQPEAKALTHVPSSWMKCLKLARPKCNLTGMTVYQFFRELAKLGGFLARKCDGEPGWQTIWAGHQKMQAWLQGMRLVDAI